MPEARKEAEGMTAKGYEEAFQTSGNILLS